MGWKIKGTFPAGMEKCVVMMAPHTSMWDFVIGRLGFWVLRVPVRFLIKKEMFVFPIRHLLLWLGGIPVDRKSKNNMVNFVTDLFNRSETLFVVITPEGTRKLNPHWKKGFYYISRKAGVPLALGFLDYKKKEGGVGRIFKTTGNFSEDFAEIENFYRNFHAKHPERFNLTGTSVI